MSHIDPAPSLGALGFLVGRFRGEGTLQRGATTFEKDVVGRWEVAGHFLSLCMSASYRVNDRVMDVHHAMALVGVERGSGAFRAHVFTDGGEILVSRTTAEDCSGEISSAEPRAVELKGITGLVEVVSIDWR